MTDDAASFLAQETLFHDVGSAELAYRKVGAGPPLLLMHGWPLWGFTWRRLLARLSARYTCYVVDTPGGGFTRWKADHDFKFAGQARSFARFLEGMNLSSVRVVAHDTGATIARQLALIAPERIERLALIGTEIPGHRPPWIPLFQKTAALPGAAATFRLLLRAKAFLRSPLA